MCFNYKDDLINTLSVLKNGGIILYPTDTVWGIGCDASNNEAVNKIYEIKKREDRKSMLVLLDDPGKLHLYIWEIPEIAFDLIGVADKPLTIIYPGGKNLAPSLLSENGSIGIRITSDPFCMELIRQLGKPIVSTSANISGTNYPAYFNEISEEIKKSMDYIIQWRQDDFTKNRPSSIIQLEAGGVFKILRK